MTVDELREALREWDGTMEVVASIEADDGTLYDSVVTSAYVSLGRVFLGTGDDD